ncbi:MAG: hypothetical protein ABIV06_12440 [Thermoanaerobaculia bacterium]
MSNLLRLALSLIVLSTCLSAPASAGEHRFGGGVHYWQSVDQLDDDFPEFEIHDDGISGVLSYQYLAGFIRFEGAAEYFDKGFQGSRDWAISPQVYVLAGRGIYGGLGVGVTYSDFANGHWSDPYYIAKAGVDFLLLPKIHLDINADYRFLEWEDLGDYDSDTITFGATVRVGF